MVKQLLTEQEALIIPLNGKYYRATSWSHTNEVMLKRVYKDVMLSCGGENLTIFSTFQSDEVIHLRYDNARIRLYLQNVVGQFDKTMDSINAMMQLSSQPRFKLKLPFTTRRLSLSKCFRFSTVSSINLFCSSLMLFASLSLCLCCNYMSHTCKCQYCFCNIVAFLS